MYRFLFSAMLMLAAAPAVAQTPLPTYILVETVRKPELAFSPDCGSQIKWTEPILKGNADPDIEQEGEVDGRVLIENGEDMSSQWKIMSLIEWTRPIHDMRVDRLVMYLAAQDMRRGTVFRVMTTVEAVRNPGEEFGPYGQPFIVWTPYQSTIARGVTAGLGGFISTAVNQGYYEIKIRVAITDGGNCNEEPVIYRFRRLEEGETPNGNGDQTNQGDQSSQDDQAGQPESANIVLQSDFEDFGAPSGPWGNNVLYGEKGIWWTSRGAKATATVITLQNRDAKTGLYIKNESARGPHVYGTTARRVSLVPGQTYKIRFMGAARNLTSNGGASIAVDPEWRVRPVIMPAGTYKLRPFEGTFIATDSYADIRIISEDRGEVVITNLIVELADDWP